MGTLLNLKQSMPGSFFGEGGRFALGERGRDHGRVNPAGVVSFQGALLILNRRKEECHALP